MAELAQITASLGMETKPLHGRQDVATVATFPSPAASSPKSGCDLDAPTVAQAWAPAFHTGVGLGPRGISVGEEVSAVGTAWCFDPLQAYTDGLITSPNILVLGVVGSGSRLPWAGASVRPSAAPSGGVAVRVEVERPEPQARTNDLDAGEHRRTNDVPALPPPPARRAQQDLHHITAVFEGFQSMENRVRGPVGYGLGRFANGNRCRHCSRE